MARSRLAPATILSTINILKRFFSWLAMQPGYKSQIKAADIEYLNLSEKATRAASAPTNKKYPTLEMIRTVVSQMPDETPVQKRDRALIAFTAVTGIRDGAIVTLKLKHFDADRKHVPQNPLEVATKFGKRIDTFLFPLDDDLEQIVLDWASFLRIELLFADHDPLFPKTAMALDANDCFKPIGLSKEHWANASPIRKVFKAAFEIAGLPNYTPHRFRNTIVSEMYRRGLSIAEFKAWSQNLGHEGAMTTLNNYGSIELEEQEQLVRNPAVPNEIDLTNLFRQFLREKKEQG